MMKTIKISTLCVYLFSSISSIGANESPFASIGNKVDLLDSFGIKTSPEKYDQVNGACEGKQAWYVRKHRQVTIPTTSLFPDTVPSEFSIVAIAQTNKKKKFQHLFNIYQNGTPKFI